MNQSNRSKTNRRRDAIPTIAEIRAARERAGLTRTEAARRIHSPLCAWICWESKGEENRPMHPGLFELFLIKTGQTDVPGRGHANDGDGFDESARFDECVAEAGETATQSAQEAAGRLTWRVREDFFRQATQSAQEAAGRLAWRVREDFFRPKAAKAEVAVELYVTRHGLRRIAKPLVEPSASPRLYIVR